MKNARILMLVGIGLIGLILTDRQVLRAQGGSGTILFEPPPSFVAAPQTDPWARLSGVIPKEDLHGKSVNMIVVLRDHPFMRFVKEQGPPGKGLTSELRKELADKFRALYQDKLHREHERIIDQIWTLEKQRVKKAGGDPTQVPKTPLRYEYFFLLNGFATTATYDLMSDIQKLGSVETVSVDRPLTPRLHETVPFLSARGAQNAGIDGSGQTIAILDTGIDWTHADFAPCNTFPGCKVVGGCDLTKCLTCDPADPLYDPACVTANPPMDTWGHGSAVARIAAANRRMINGIDYSGMAPGATLMAYKVVGGYWWDNGGGLSEAMENITTDGLTDVVNISMDVGCDNPPDMFGVCNSNSPIATQIRNATDLGIVVSVAVANGGAPGEFSRMSSPEFVPDAISVGATRKTDDVLASYTSNGPSWVCFVDSGPGDPDTSKCNPERGEILPTLKPDLVAPGGRGHGIYQDNICFSGSCSESAAGTSLASPHVAGAAALILQSLNPQDPDLGARSRTVKAVLMESASFLPDGIARTPYEQGAGRLNVSTAVQVQAMVLPPSLNLGRAACGADTVISVPLTLKNYRPQATQFTLNFSDSLDPKDPALWTVTFDGNPPPDYTVAVGPAPGPGCPPPGLGCPREMIVTAAFTLRQDAPHPPYPHIAYEGQVLVSPTGTPPLHIPVALAPNQGGFPNFEPSPPAMMVVHDRQDFQIFWTADMPRPSLADGNYDFIALWMPTDTEPTTIVFRRETITCGSPLLISKDEANINVTLNFKDHTGVSFEQLPLAGYFASFSLKENPARGFSFPFIIPISYKAFKFSRVDTADYVVSFLPLAFTASGDAVVLTKEESSPLDTDREVSAGGPGETYNTFTFRDDSQPYFQPGAGGPSLGEPVSHYPPQGFLECFQYFSLPVGGVTLHAMLPPNPNFFWRDLQMRSGQKVLIRGFLPFYCFFPMSYSNLWEVASLTQLQNYFFDTPPITDITLATPGTLRHEVAPQSWFGKFQNDPTIVRVSPGVGRSKHYTHYPFQDYHSWEGFPSYFLSVDGTSVRSGRLGQAYEFGAPVEEVFSLPAAGTVLFQTTSYYYFPGGQIGILTADASFASGAGDPNPPWLRRFVVEEGVIPQDTLHFGTTKGVKFIPNDQPGASLSASLKYIAGGCEVPLPLSSFLTSGVDASVSLPEFPQTMPVSLKLELTDPAGNLLRQRQEPAFLYERPRTWTKLILTGGPVSNRLAASGIWDAGNKRMVIFGGWDGSVRNDSWSLQVTGPDTGQWTQLFPSGTLPPARWAHGAVYDAPRQRMLMFGGSVNPPGYWPGGNNDIWELTLTSGAETWRQLLPADPPPEGRAQMAIAAADGLGAPVIIFGGIERLDYAGPLITFNDLWAVDLTGGGDGKWVQIPTTGGPPSPRQGPVMMVDPKYPRLLLFGGVERPPIAPPPVPGVWLNDLWELTLSGPPLSGTWSLLSPYCLPPSGRLLPAAASVPEGEVIIFGGNTAVGDSNETWMLQPQSDGTVAWFPVVAGGVTLPGNAGMTSAFDPEGRNFIVQGGSGSGLFDDVWVLR